MKTKFIIFLLCLLIVVAFSSCEGNVISDEERELVRTEIIEWKGFDPEAIAWREVEKIEDRDCYIFSCIVEGEDIGEDIIQYTFAVKIEYIDGEIDIDAWEVYVKGGAEKKGGGE